MGRKLKKSASRQEVIKLSEKYNFFLIYPCSNQHRSLSDEFCQNFSIQIPKNCSNLNLSAKKKLKIIETKIKISLKFQVLSFSFFNFISLTFHIAT